MSEEYQKTEAPTRGQLLTTAAASYRDEHGWVTIRTDGKDAFDTGWTKRTLESPLPVFRDKDNLGIVLGKNSGHLVRYDPDFPPVDQVHETLFGAIPEAIFGRESKPKSARLLISPGAKSKDFRLPTSVAGNPRLPKHDNKPSVTVLQILSTGKQTMAPPSIHPDTKEVLAWSALPEKLAEVEPKRLLKLAGIEATLMVARQFWPAQGSRNEAAMALARVLLEALADEEPDEERRIAIVDDLVTFTAMDGGAGEESRKGKQRAAATLEKMKAGEEATGLTTLVELLGLPKDVVGTIRKWLGLRIEPSGYRFDAAPSPELEPFIDKLNEEYALVIVGDKAAVMHTAADGTFKFMAVSAFEIWHANKNFSVGGKLVPLAKYWLRHPKRRQYRGIVFSPSGDVAGHFNLWRGFAVEPRSGDCSKFLAHMKDNVCCGNEARFKWVMAWWADMYQHPDSKPGTSLGLRGPQGVGKTKVGEVFGSLLGSHYTPVSDPRYVTGRFNSHLVSCLLLHCDEAFWAGDRSAEGRLKDLITGREHLVELKGKEPIRVRNFVRLFATGNPDWLVPAGFQERRFAVFDVGEDHIQDSKYFAAIDAEMKNGGREALLDYLLKFDLSGVNLRETPKTEALLDQQISSLNPEQSWWLDLLMSGELPWGISEARKCLVSKLMEDYLRHAQRQGARRRSIEVQLGIFLKKYVPGLTRARESYVTAQESFVGKGEKTNNDIGYVYTFPPLKECRAEFSKRLGQEIVWHEKDEWTMRPADPM